MTLTEEANAKKNWNQSQKSFGLIKAYFCGHPVIQAVEAKMIGHIYEKFIFLQNISSLKKSAISIHYELR